MRIIWGLMPQSLILTDRASGLLRQRKKEALLGKHLVHRNTMRNLQTCWPKVTHQSASRSNAFAFRRLLHLENTKPQIIVRRLPRTLRNQLPDCPQLG